MRTLGQILFVIFLASSISFAADGQAPSAPKLPDSKQYRTWTSQSGRHHTEARLLDWDDESVTLLKSATLGVAVVSLKDLSDTDRVFVTSLPDKLIVGKVIGVTDGDTLRVRSGSTNHIIRLEGIDAPESGQDYGAKSKAALSKLTFGKEVRIRWREFDRYSRELGDVFVDTTWVNFQLVKDGWAWHFVKYSSDKDLAIAESHARESRLGLWADPNKPLAPWEFRDRRREKGKNLEIAESESKPLIDTAPRALSTTPDPKDQTQEPASDTAISKYWLNTSSNVRHNASCKHFGNTKRGRPCTSDEGKPCGICGG